MSLCYCPCADRDGAVPVFKPPTALPDSKLKPTLVARARSPTRRAPGSCSSVVPLALLRLAGARYCCWLIYLLVCGRRSSLLLSSFLQPPAALRSNAPESELRRQHSSSDRNACVGRSPVKFSQTGRKRKNKPVVNQSRAEACSARPPIISPPLANDRSRLSYPP